MSRPIITLTTDFGPADGYAGAMKGIILGICPDAMVVDISHEVGPQAVRQAAYLLSTVTPYFPQGTVHLVVVDPGVGSDRRAIAVQCGRATYVAPDNGVLSLALALDPPQTAVQILAGQPISATFHGRDLFAPVAARLACGAGLGEVGVPIAVGGLVRLSNLAAERQADGSWLGQIVHVDRFGNLITDIELPMTGDAAAERRSRAVVWVGKARIEGVKSTYSDVVPGEPVAYVGSSGRVEIALRDGSAAARLGVGVGDAVRVEGLP